MSFLTCGQSVGDCPYVVDLTSPLDTEAPSVPVSCTDDGITMRDPRLKRDLTNDR